MILTEVNEAPGTYTRAQLQSRKLVLEVEELLSGGKDLRSGLDKIRKASGMFKGAAEAVKAR